MLENWHIFAPDKRQADILQASAISVLGGKKPLEALGNTVDVAHLQPGIYHGADHRPRNKSFQIHKAMKKTMHFFAEFKAKKQQI